jgi:hypothetical protein
MSTVTDGPIETVGPRTAHRPTSTRFEPVPVNEASTAGSSRTPSRLARRARTIWQYWHATALSGLLPPSPPLHGSGCPQLHRAAATAQRRWSFTSDRNNRRLTAHVAQQVHDARLDDRLGPDGPDRWSPKSPRIGGSCMICFGPMPVGCSRSPTRNVRPRHGGWCPGTRTRRSPPSVRSRRNAPPSLWWSRISTASVRRFHQR